MLTETQYTVFSGLCVIAIICLVILAIIPRLLTLQEERTIKKFENFDKNFHKTVGAEIYCIEVCVKYITIYFKDENQRPVSLIEVIIELDEHRRGIAHYLQLLSSTLESIISNLHNDGLKDDDIYKYMVEKRRKADFFKGQYTCFQTKLMQYLETVVPYLESDGEFNMDTYEKSVLDTMDLIDKLKDNLAAL